MPPKTTRKRGRSNGHRPPAPAAPLADAGTIREGTFITDRGQTIRIVGISPWLLENQDESLRAEWIEKKKGLPVAPTYSVELPGDENEIHEHDAESIKTASPEERAAWDAYLIQQDAWAAELQERMEKLLFIRGVQSRPVDDEWIAEQQYMGIRVPDHLMDRRRHWVRTEVISSPHEAVRLMNAIMALSGVDAEAVRAAEESFRLAMEEQNRAKAADAAARGGRLVSYADIPRSENGEGMGPDAV